MGDRHDIGCHVMTSSNKVHTEPYPLIIYTHKVILPYPLIIYTEHNFTDYEPIPATIPSLQHQNSRLRARLANTDQGKHWIVQELSPITEGNVYADYGPFDTKHTAELWAAYITLQASI
jgi:hypothetical protein